jgi:tetratricopeptide (TPR) repeat protein
MSGDPDQGLEDMRKEVSLHPDDLDSYRVLGFSLMSVRRNREAQQVWQDLLKHDPDDWNAAANLGNLLTQDKKYSEALVQYQSAVKNKPDSASLYNGLGVAALHAGNAKMGVDSLDKAVELDPKLANDVAYELAENKQALDKALDFAKRAVAEQEQKSSEFKLDSLELDDLRTVDLLSAYWDTLGWVYFEMGDMQSARRFLNAAWSLSQGPVEADHLGQVYEGLGQPNKAVEMYALALATDGQMPETRERLIKLVSSEAKVNEEIAAARDKASRLRELHIQRKSAEKGSAEFFLLLQRGTNNADVKYIRGDEGLKSFVPEIAASKFDPQFPDDANTKIIRRGILDCTSLGCDFVLIRPSDVHSVE